MTLITDSNYLQWAPRMRRTLFDSHFVAIDFEFLGLDTSAISLHDTTEKRYAILRANVKKYRPCQLGLSIFKQLDNGSYVADTYSIPLYRRVGTHDTATNTHSMRFLMNQGFDMNQVFSEGVEYCTREEYGEFTKALERGEALRFINQENIGQIECMKVMLEEKIYQIAQGRVTRTTVETISPATISLDHGAEISLIIPGVTSIAKSCLEVCMIIHELTKAYPQFHFKASNEKTHIIAQNRPACLPEKENLRLTAERCCDAFEGVSGLIDSALSMHKVVVGHNSLLDCMYLHHYFFSALPTRYSQFKKSFHSICGSVVDTKILAQVLRPELTGVGNSLQMLGDFFETNKSDLLVPPELRGSIKAWKDVQDEENGNVTIVESDEQLAMDKKYHDAAYDAFITGSIFLKLAHIFINKRNNFRNSVIRFKRMLEFLAEPIENRIPFQLLDVGFCNLNGEDADGQRPDVIKIVRRDRRPVSDEEYRKQETDLAKIMATYRFSIERTKDKAAILLATNTPSSYAFLCEKYSKNETLAPFDELETGVPLSFEQRQMAWRSHKDEIAALRTVPKRWARGQVKAMEASLID